MKSIFHKNKTHITLENISLPCRVLDNPTPAGLLTIYLLEIHSLSLLSDQITKLLPEERRTRTMRYVRQPDRLRSLGAGFLIEYIRRQHRAGELHFTELGKPYFPRGPHFNLSHSGQYVAMAVSDHPVGIDIEEIHPVKDSLIQILHPEEIAYINRQEDASRAFFRLWTRKESLMKCTGQGIAAIPVGDIPSLPGQETEAPPQPQPQSQSRDEGFTFRGQQYRRITTENDQYALTVTTAV